MELLIGCAGDGGVESEVDFRDCESCFLLNNGYLSGCFNFVGGEVVSTENGGECHAEASGVGGADEFFGVGALSFFEPRSERVRGIVEGVCFGGDGSFSVENSTLPDGATGAYHSFARLPGGDVKAWAESKSFGANRQ